MPLITVLMPAYNAAPYLKEAIDSVLRQTVTDFELLVINDGSTDETDTILHSYSDSRIRLLYQENQGVIGALNTGLQLARGRWIARFDADDICYPERLRLQLDYLERHPDCVLLGGAADYIDKDGHFLFEWQPGGYDTASLKEAILRESPFDHPTVIYDRQTALKIGGYPAGALQFEDHLFWTRFFAFGAVANLRQPLIRHRFNPGSVTVDERWRGPEFREIKYRSVRQGAISEADAVRLKVILAGQDLQAFKEAAYYSMIGKKYLWNQHDPVKARAHLRRAIALMPGKPAPYLLYLLSFLPASWITRIYQRVKQLKP